MPHFKKALRISGFLLLLLICIFILSICLDNKSATFKHTMNDFYNNDTDVVFLGASNIYTSIVPTIIQQKTDMVNYNLATSSQSIKSSKHLLKEVFRVDNPKYVVVGFSTLSLSYQSEKEYELIVLSGMENSFAKFKYFLQDFEMRDTLYYFNIDPQTFSIANIFNKTYIDRLLNYNQGFVVADNYTYDKGFYTTNAMYQQTFFEGIPFKKQQDNIDDLKEISDLCKQNNAELIILSTPYSLDQFNLNQDGQQYNDFMQSFAKQENFTFLNGDLLKVEHFNGKNDNFTDYAHFTTDGGFAFSQSFGEILDKINKDEFNYDDYFYQDYKTAKQMKNK